MVLPEDQSWLEQLEGMQAAVSAVKLADHDNFYGKDILQSGDDFSSEGHAWPWGEDEGGEEVQGRSYDLHWLRDQCEIIAGRSFGLSSGELESQILDLLKSGSSDEDLQIKLTDVLGFDDLEFIIDLIGHRLEVTKPVDGPRLLNKKEREAALRRADYEHKNAQLGPKLDRDEPKYPHVYKTYSSGNTLSWSGHKYGLPQGSEKREHKTYDEFSVPAAKVGVLGKGQSLVMIKDMDRLCQGTFKGYKALNRMQSLVYPVAYKTSENMLICAPTGAGKTDAAMLTILHTIGRYITDPESVLVKTTDFKIVYVAPMKALAAEVVEKLGKRLKWLNIRVRELTGDMHLTKAEIIETQIIVTTPEKWDVVTRKGTGDTELVQKVRLLIIDEVHMLHDTRGAVLESLVARTQRQVESTQSLIRIVGLSATLPNYVDVADFLKVNRYAGLFYFDASFRPVPLEQHFIGVKGKPGTKTSRDNLDNVSFEKVKKMLEAGHQIMVFVHSRKDTLNTARLYRKLAIDQQCVDLFDPSFHELYNAGYQQMKEAKSRDLRELYQQGFGVHHAGMDRGDRNIVEKLFGDGIIKVLCCTATLAWGVNLPAAAVVIKGTQIYSAQEGKFVDLGILDVLQIFGRAGRPQFQDTGIGFICTTHDKLQHYLNAVTQQHPIESQFSAKLVDNLNAEIALGTVTTVQEGVQWLGYSYMHVRMRRNPLNYGIEWSEYQEDPQLVQRRRQLILKAAATLRDCQMISFDESSEQFRSRDIGRIASQYYILNGSIQQFNEKMQPFGTEADMFRMLSKSEEFDNIQFRDTEATELQLLKDLAATDIEGTVDQTDAKTNILLQAFISRARIEDFALVSDSAYVAQNSARLCRAVFMISLHRRWGLLCQVMLSLCKSIDKRAWAFHHPLSQFNLPPNIVNILNRNEDYTIEYLRKMNVEALGVAVNNPRMGKTLRRLLDNFPILDVKAEFAPVNHDVLHMRVVLTPDFVWNVRHHGGAEPYWIWVENAESSEIYHHEFFILSQRKFAENHELNFSIPLPQPVPSELYVRCISDRWLGAETLVTLSLENMVIPEISTKYTELLELEPLHISALKNPILEEIYAKRSSYFNQMQTQIFPTLYESSTNVLLGSPTGSGKTTAAELAMWHAFKEHPGSKVVYIAPMKALVRERLNDWRKRLAPMGLKITELTGDNTPDARIIKQSDVIISTPEKWDGISRNWERRDYVSQVSLIIFDEIHLLGGDRGPVLEMIVSRMNHLAAKNKLPIRLLGMSTASANAEDVADWLGAKDGLFNFRNSVRPVPLEIYVEGFADQSAFATLMQSMNRPAFLAIKAHSPDRSVLIFVASRKQTRLTAMDLINLCAVEDNPRRFAHMEEEELELHLSRAKDEGLKEALAFGIGLHHAGLAESDRHLSEELFAANKIQVLIATSTLAWGVNLPAHMVIVKGTQYFDAKADNYRDMDLTDVLQMLGRAGRPQFDTSGVACIFTKDAQKSFYQYFLHTGFPIESSLHKVLDDHLAAEIASGTIKSIESAVNFLTYTFFARRLHKNPSYYGFDIKAADSGVAGIAEDNFLAEIVRKSVAELQLSECVILGRDNSLSATPYGKIATSYYISHKTVRRLLEHASITASLEECLVYLANAAEFDELPVRHNEDEINTKLWELVPVTTSPDTLMRPLAHQKAFLLLQVHMSRIKLPLADYIGDLNSMLDQTIRVLQALIDCLLAIGGMQSCTQMIILMQCIKSGRWPGDGSLSILPGVKPGQDYAKSVNIVEAGAMSVSQAEDLSKKLGVPASAKVEFMRALKQIPNVRCSVDSVQQDKVMISLRRVNRTNSDFRAYCPRFPKAQTESWFALLCNEDSNKVLSMKRVYWQKGKAIETKGKSLAKLEAEMTDGEVFGEASVNLTIEKRDMGTPLTVWILSDTYMGYHLKTLKITPPKE